MITKDETVTRKTIKLNQKEVLEAITQYVENQKEYHQEDENGNIEPMENYVILGKDTRIMIYHGDQSIKGELSAIITTEFS